MEEVGGFRREFDGAQDYDFIFRCVEKPVRLCMCRRFCITGVPIRHLPQIILQARCMPFEAGRRAIEAHLERTGVKGTVSHTADLGFYRVKYPIQGHPLVSIIIPQ